MIIRVLILRHRGRGADLRTLGVAQQDVDARVETCSVSLDPKGARNALVEALRDGGADYVALIDDRDCWTDPSKLRRQVEWLESEDGSPACFHSVAGLDESTDEPWTADAPDGAERFGMEDVWQKSNFIAPSSLVFRGDALETAPDWLGRPVVSLGFGLAFLLVRGGSIGAISGCLASCAEDPRKAGSQLPDDESEIVERRFVNARFDFRYAGMLDRFVAWHGLDLARACLAQKRVTAARRHFWRAWTHLPLATTLLAGTLPLRLLFARPTRDASARV